MILAEGADVPLQSKLRGLGALPVWFVRWPQLEAAADRILTIGEFAGLPSRIAGSADLYTETLHPYGGAKVSKLTLVSRGALDDGRGFESHANVLERSVMVVHVEFR